MAPSRGNLRPLTPKVLLANTAPNIIGFSDGCRSIRAIGAPGDWEAPSKYRRLSALGPVYRQFYSVQCSVKYENRAPRRGTPKKVILCWAGVPSPGLKPEELVPGRPGMTNPVWVSCSCNYFRYVCEWALSRYGSSDIIYSNGQPAHFTNPYGVGTLCKHIYAVFPLAMQAWAREAPKERALRPKVEETPVLPELPPEKPEEPEPSEEPEEPELIPEEEGEEEAPREASYTLSDSGLYIPSHLVTAAKSLRSIALQFDAECC